ncbi:MAG: RNA-binding S4 domain-containing protein [Alphaproteobacteria bacterium]|nr:RNA-binding S4 domain-containing protein [Alphaproteobacteria bacterium]
MSEDHRSPSGSNRRLDQWLWFARLVKTRSLAARLCAAGVVTLNGLPVRKSNRIIRVGDVVVAPQGAYQRTVRVVAMGTRRGPAIEARQLYEEVATPARLAEAALPWEPLLIEAGGKD